MCSPGWGIFGSGQGIWRQIFEKMSNLHPMPWLNIDRYIIIQLKKYLSSWMLKRDVLSGSKIAIVIQRAKVGKKTRQERISIYQLRYNWRFPFFFGKDLHLSVCAVIPSAWSRMEKGQSRGVARIFPEVRQRSKSTLSPVSQKVSTQAVTWLNLRFSSVS